MNSELIGQLNLGGSTYNGCQLMHLDLADLHGSQQRLPRPEAGPFTASRRISATLRARVGGYIQYIQYIYIYIWIYIYTYIICIQSILGSRAGPLPRLQSSALGLRVQGLGIEIGVSDFGFWVSGFGFRVSGFGGWVQGLGPLPRC